MSAPILGLAGAVLLLSAACGGGGGGDGAPPEAARLSFTAPSGATGFRFERNPTSTDTRLILDLHGPAGAAVRGVALFLSVDPHRATWANAGGPGGTWSLPGGTFDLGAPPCLYADKAVGSMFQVGIFQKSGAAILTDAQPIVSVALDLVPGIPPGPVVFQPTPGRQAVILGSDGTTTPIQALDLGTLVAD
jgi:hypothetical protein